MNILLLSRIVARTGVGNHIIQLHNELLAQGHNVWIGSAYNTLDNSLPEWGGVRVSMNTRNPIQVLRNLAELHNIIQTHHIDIVHCHHRIASLYMRWYNRLWKCPYVYTLHLAPIPDDFLHRMFTSCGNRSIAISKGVGDFLHNNFHVPQQNISYILNGVDDKLLSPLSTEEKKSVRKQFNIMQDKVVISLHSRITEVKNQIGVVKALSLLPQTVREKIIVLCSGEKEGPYYEQVCEAIQRDKLENNFVFCGWQDARSVIGCSDLMLLPSFAEGFALNCIEAMFLKVPVARTATAGYTDLADHLHKISDTTPKAIAELIMDFYDHKKKFTSKVESAYMFVNENCTIKIMTEKTVDVYKKVLQL